VKLNADLPEPNIALGLILQRMGRNDEARQYFEKAIALDGRNHQAYQALAKAYSGLHDYPNAEAAYRKAISLRPDDWTGYKALALFYYEREDYAQAAEQFQKVVDLTPDNAQGYLNVGAANAGLQKWDAAKRAWLRAIELDPKNHGAMTNVGKIYQDEGQTAKAIEMYQRALALNDRSFRAWGQLGRAWLQTNERDKANQAFAKTITLLDQELAINPKSVILYSTLGFYRALSGRRDFSDPVERALQMAPNRAETLIRAAEAYAIGGNKQRAGQLLNQAVAAGIPQESVERSEYLSDLRKPSGTK
jgi:tetratricopeptide (TPR) repeat protein